MFLTSKFLVTNFFQNRGSRIYIHSNSYPPVPGSKTERTSPTTGKLGNYLPPISSLRLLVWDKGRR
jgi:hypothetical protein